MDKTKWLKSLFSVIDQRDTDGFLKFLTPDCCFRFGNMPAAVGKEQIGQAVGTFFDSINGLSHDLKDVWHTETATICHGLVAYTRKENTELTVPFTNILYLSEEHINQYLIFIDISELY